eukprot:scaffold3240_cov197-Alexandrium_tamarense.AAC.29
MGLGVNRLGVATAPSISTIVQQIIPTERHNRELYLRLHHDVLITPTNDRTKAFIKPKPIVTKR